ncbi:hypothetical protein CK228_25550 [Mesorhizobium sp. WSM4312]|jgi:hypothetical protein|nr:hypothetical protein CK232_29125 [Mesorhizobium sp. WSM4304]PBB46184.1 hypothetical protein CK213_28710 [Mesorhizobium loti]PBB65784.1 hypothetical protein CK228_25550 [Mesorhizobium sp. WSM4312]PBB71942.1 hypothetical protein CK227_29095 [Mesorhizobium sp. WSM4308]PBC19822.1 hypothetical protein CK226_27145 [Mesorhizobium sp. WSM4311]
MRRWRRRAVAGVAAALHQCKHAVAWRRHSSPGVGGFAGKNAKARRLAAKLKVVSMVLLAEADELAEQLGAFVGDPLARTKLSETSVACIERPMKALCASRCEMQPI